MIFDLNEEMNQKENKTEFLGLWQHKLSHRLEQSFRKLSSISVLVVFLDDGLLGIKPTDLSVHFLTYVGQVAVVAGGDLGGASLNTVEVFSPDGGCQYSLAALPKPLAGLSLTVSSSYITACSGYTSTTKLVNLLCWTYDIFRNTWYSQPSSLTTTKPYYPSLVYGTSIYFVNDVASEKFTTYYSAGASAWATAPPTATGDGACGVGDTVL